MSHVPRPPEGLERRRAWPYWIVAIATKFIAGAYVRIRVEGVERLPPGPSIIAFNHMSWADPFILVAGLPARPRLLTFGPKEDDITSGTRNRLMVWSGRTVPFRPGKDDLLDTTRRVGRAMRAGYRLAIAPEGRIHAGESVLLPFDDGAAFFATRSRVPIVPVAINGTGWLRFGRRIRVRVGEPIRASGRPTKTALAATTAAVRDALAALIADFPDEPPPGRFGRWFTEAFNEWPEGERPPLPGDGRTDRSAEHMF